MPQTSQDRQRPTIETYRVRQEAARLVHPGNPRQVHAHLVAPRAEDAAKDPDRALVQPTVAL